MALVFTEDGESITSFRRRGRADSAPLWGGLAALADQYAHRDLGFINPAIYSIARSSSYHKSISRHHNRHSRHSTATRPPPDGTR